MNHLKSFKLFESTSSHIMYHASNFDSDISIEENGLNRSLGTKQYPNHNYPDGIYLFDNLDDAKRYAVIMLDNGDVYEVDIKGLDVQDDPEETKNSWFEGVNSYYTTDVIEPSRINKVEFSEDEKDQIWLSHGN